MCPVLCQHHPLETSPPPWARPGHQVVPGLPPCAADPRLYYEVLGKVARCHGDVKDGVLLRFTHELRQAFACES